MPNLNIVGERFDTICVGSGVCGGGVRRREGEDPPGEEEEEEGGVRGHHREGKRAGQQSG